MCAIAHFANSVIKAPWGGNSSARRRGAYDTAPAMQSGSACNAGFLIRWHRFATFGRTSGKGVVHSRGGRFCELISPEWWITLWGIRWETAERARQSWTVWPLKRSPRPADAVWG